VPSTDNIKSFNGPGSYRLLRSFLFKTPKNDLRKRYLELVFARVAVGLLTSKGHAKPDCLLAFTDLSAFVEPSFICIDQSGLDTLKLALQENRLWLLN
jgi:hypothetical protein